VRIRRLLPLRPLLEHRPGTGSPTDAWITLAGLARETAALRLGTLVSAATFRDPGALAVIAAQVDVMSGGRVELGLGTGYHQGEHLAYGIPFPSVPERFERLEEQLGIVTGLWTTRAGGQFIWQGVHYQLSVRGDLPRTVQQPHPPIIVGGSGRRRTPALAARFASEFNIGLHSAAEARAQYERVRRACEAVGRDPAQIGMSGVLIACCGSNEREVARRARSIGMPLEQLSAAAAAGTPAQVIERCAEGQEAGAETLYLQIRDLDDHDHLRLIGEQVLPYLA
jgi:alkanesulfonate monooxygenase SsuD/methylene tetrahydromethanopterin reductase-like flavin-dependent oxidoreductase (luciferase family)